MASFSMQVNGALMERGRSKRAWMELVKIDLNSKRPSRIHVVDPDIVGTRV